MHYIINSKTFCMWNLRNSTLKSRLGDFCAQELWTDSMVCYECMCTIRLGLTIILVEFASHRLSYYAAMNKLNKYAAATIPVRREEFLL